MPRAKGSQNKITIEVKKKLQNLIDSCTALSYCIKNYFLFMLLIMMTNPPPRTQIRGISKLLVHRINLKKNANTQSKSKKL